MDREDPSARAITGCPAVCSLAGRGSGKCRWDSGTLMMQDANVRAMDELPCQVPAPEPLFFTSLSSSIIVMESWLVHLADICGIYDWVSNFGQMSICHRFYILLPRRNSPLIAYSLEVMILLNCWRKWYIFCEKPSLALTMNALCLHLFCIRAVSAFPSELWVVSRITGSSCFHLQVLCESLFYVSWIY